MAKTKQYESISCTTMTMNKPLFVTVCVCAISLMVSSGDAFNASEDVRFHLFTADNGTAGEQLWLNESSLLKSSSFNASDATRFLIHGWYGDFTSGINYRMRNAYHQHAKPINVIVVDWSPTSTNPNYVTVRNVVPRVGRAIGEFVQFMRSHGGLRLNTTHLIGHSLGAHVAGFAGKFLQQYSTSGDDELAAIVGLDPARPLFDIAKPAERLASSDARYVETIHTNRGLKGFSRPIGDAAFYPNWGARQVGCGTDLLGSCSHTRAVLFFEESILRPESRWFRGTRCAYGYDEIKKQVCTATGWADMGGEPLLGAGGEKAAGGVYYVPTRDRSPFGMAQPFF